MNEVEVRAELEGLSLRVTECEALTWPRTHSQRLHGGLDYVF
jgi:hypothetical protein